MKVKKFDCIEMMHRVWIWGLTFIYGSTGFSVKAYSPQSMSCTYGYSTADENDRVYAANYFDQRDRQAVTKRCLNSFS